MYFTILLRNAGDRMLIVDAKSEAEAKQWANEYYGKLNFGPVVAKSKSGDIDWYGKDRIRKI